MNGEFYVIFGLAVIVVAIQRPEWFHKLLALVFRCAVLALHHPAVRTAVACNVSPVAQLR
jgi:hypothetical protein